MSVTMTNEEQVEIQKRGLEDGIKHLLSCNYCGNPLMIVWEVCPNFRFADGKTYYYDYQAKCPYCYNESARKKIYGEIRFLNIVEEKTNTDGSTYEKNITVINDIKNIEEDNLCLIMVGKAKG